jgi:hypothetical protein
VTQVAYVLFYGLVAAASPLVLTATLVIVRSDRKRTNGIAFLSGFVLGTAIACIVGLIVGQALVDRLNSHETVGGALVLVVGVALVVIALRVRHKPLRADTESGRGAAILAGLEHVGPAAAVSMAGLLGFGGPKRLVLTLLAMATVREAALAGVADLALVALYIAVATMLVSVPIVILIVTGSRGADIVQRGESWIGMNMAVIRLWVWFGLGAALVVDGLVRLAR